MFEQGDIVVVPFPFTDLTSIKQRPVLILSKNEYNQRAEDVITCGITSNLSNAQYSILINNSHLAEGAIPVKSRVKVDKIFTISKSLVRKQIAALRREHFAKVREEFLKLV